MGYRRTVQDQGERPLPLDRLSFPPSDPSDKIAPFEAAVIMPHNIRAEHETGNYLEAVQVMAACDSGERVFVKFHRTGSTGWVTSDRLVDR